MSILKNGEAQAEESFYRLVKTDEIANIKDKEVLLRAILNPQELSIYKHCTSLANMHDQKIILQSLELMYQGYLSGLRNSEILSDNPLSTYEVFQVLKKAFSYDPLS